MFTEPIMVSFNYGALNVSTKFTGDITELPAFIRMLDMNIPSQFKPDPEAAIGATMTGVKISTITLPVKWIERGSERGKEFLKLGGGEYQQFGVHIYEDSCNDKAEVLQKLEGYKRWEGERVQALEAVVLMNEAGKPKRVIELRWKADSIESITF